MPTEDAQESKKFREQYLRYPEGSDQIIKNILRITTKAGDTRSVEFQSIIEEESDEFRNLIAMTDITPIIIARDELEGQVEIDELTGLISRRGL
ncbi:MAG: hypothetical protein ACSHWQ_05085 [Spongiibacteraceae bacterium]